MAISIYERRNPKAARGSSRPSRSVVVGFRLNRPSGLKPPAPRRFAASLPRWIHHPLVASRSSHGEPPYGLLNVSPTHGHARTVDAHCQHINECPHGFSTVCVGRSMHTLHSRVSTPAPRPLAPPPPPFFSASSTRSRGPLGRPISSRVRIRHERQIRQREHLRANQRADVRGEPEIEHELRQRRVRLRRRREPAKG